MKSPNDETENEVNATHLENKSSRAYATLINPSNSMIYHRKSSDFSQFGNLGFRQVVNRRLINTDLLSIPVEHDSENHNHRSDLQFSSNISSEDDNDVFTSNNDGNSKRKEIKSTSFNMVVQTAAIRSLLLFPQNPTSKAISDEIYANFFIKFDEWARNRKNPTPNVYTSYDLEKYNEKIEELAKEEKKWRDVLEENDNP
ncbi:hypothetical protein TRFO_41694 [Tritrichomonas foetus]|uniref:Uncharacterized protein n=1 Tax=Tritrichomonas foetus TaxID=1144522 RepID=A0A1J4L3R0_9EUKA|nr:hypothetical protein TRFO_41694 [Tritrichomonas foetus]|eukprot:OHT16612.1 hypothetical protein TRFO_41694 [Tritrichomonas foetus]